MGLYLSTSDQRGTCRPAFISQTKSRSLHKHLIASFVQTYNITLLCPVTRPSNSYFPQPYLVCPSRTRFQFLESRYVKKRGRRRCRCCMGECKSFSLYEEGISKLNTEEYRGRPHGITALTIRNQSWLLKKPRGLLQKRRPYTDVPPLLDMTNAKRDS